jgi:hypothetical protein
MEPAELTDEEAIAVLWQRVASLRARLAEVEKERDDFRSQIAKAAETVVVQQQQRDAALQRAKKAEDELLGVQIALGGIKCPCEVDQIEPAILRLKEKAKRLEQAEQERGVAIADHTKAADCTNTIVAQDAAGMVSYAALAERLKQAEASVERVREVAKKVVTNRHLEAMDSGDDYSLGRLSGARELAAELEASLSPAHAAGTRMI